MAPGKESPHLSQLQSQVFFALWTLDSRLCLRLLPSLFLLLVVSVISLFSFWFMFLILRQGLR